MARPRGTYKTAPKYRQKGDRAVVAIGGKDRYLPGVFNSEESRREYSRLLREIEVRGDPRGAEAGDRSTTVSEVLAAFLAHCQKKRGLAPGKKDQYLYHVCRAVSFVRELYGDRPAHKFGPLALRCVRDRMLEENVRQKGRTHLKWTRRCVDKAVDQIKFVFRWAASYELVPPSVPQALRTVEPLGVGLAREKPAVRPAEEDILEAVLRIANPVTSAMLRVQLLTGMRPGEVCSLRGCDIEMGKPVWMYRPATHKTQYRGKSRVIPIGPQAQAILCSFMTSRTTDYLFRPKPMPGRKVRDRFITSRYGANVAYYCKRAFPVPPEIAGDPVKKCEWREDHRLFPHQLRHSFATNARAEFGLELTQQVLGHADQRTTLIYAEADLSGMARVAEGMG